MFYLYGYFSAFVVYALLSKFFPETGTHVPETIFGDPPIDASDSIHSEARADSDVEKKPMEVGMKQV
jgi:hypothetical protein